MAHVQQSKHILDDFAEMLVILQSLKSRLKWKAEA